MTKLFSYPVWCMLGLTVLILSIFVYWYYRNYNREQKWGEYWVGYSFRERCFFIFMTLFAFWFCGMTLLAIWYLEKYSIFTPLI